MHNFTKRSHFSKYFLVTCVFALNPLIAKATQVIVKGQVEFVRTHDAAILPSWAPPIFWFTLKGVNTVGNCQRFSGGNILFIGRNINELILSWPQMANRTRSKLLLMIQILLTAIVFPATLPLEIPHQPIDAIVCR